MDLFDIEQASKESEKKLQQKSLSRIHELEVLIKKYQDSYYNGEAEISDAEFDLLWDELKVLDEANPILHAVGADSGNFQKAPHVMPMGSQEKAATPEQFMSWASKHAYSEYLVEYKLDGASLELQYSHGQLLRAVTRGDGTVGDVITQNALRMKGVVKNLKNKAGASFDFTGGIRGEVIMTHDVHKNFFSSKANCRNAANGLMKRKDGEGSEHLTLIVYDVWATEGSQPFLDEEGKLAFLNECSFITVPLKICRSVQEVIDFRAHVMDTRKNLEYDIDGLVIKERTVNHEDASRARPDRQIAFKFSLEEAVTTLRAVEWNEAGATYTPVAVFDKVDLNGTVVQRASLANPNNIRTLGLKIGSRVVVVKRGEIIPKIEYAVEEEGLALSEIVFPVKCAVCGSTLIDEGTRLYCPEKNCSKRILHQLLKWVSVCDIRDLGETLVRQLFNTGRVKSISDLYTLTSQELASYFLNEESLSKEKESLGAKKVYASIQARRKISLSKFIAGFDIEGIGETVVEKLVEAGFKTLDAMLSATEESVANVYGFASVMARTFVRGMAECKAEMLHLTEDGIIALDLPLEGGKLSGLSFCFTGELLTLKRSDAQNMVKANGGSVKTSVVKGLSYLVTNDKTSGSSKNVKAAKEGIPVINEKEFLALFN